MYAPRVFASMLAVLVVFAISSYAINGSFFTAAIQTLICLVLIQAGYFVGVLYLVRREKLHNQGDPAREALVRRGVEREKREKIRTSAARNFTAHDS